MTAARREGGREDGREDKVAVVAAASPPKATEAAITSATTPFLRKGNGLKTGV